MPKQILMIPGPVELDHDVLAALSRHCSTIRADTMDGGITVKSWSQKVRYL
jgi:aspartate aminotransferase-like enzyme